jgi:hypothetical protein
VTPCRAAVALLLLFPAAGARPGDDARIDFNRDVRPILANNCLLCHGPDAKERKADLRLDVREAALSVREGRAAIVPGAPDRSELVRRITTTDADDAMPPAKTGKRLTAAQAATLKRWIEQGAPYARHWSFVRPERPALPRVRDAAWCRNEVDRFVLARLEKEGLRPSPEADRYALVRRLSLDLTGLPPTIEEADAFAKDAAPGAVERQVDRLLASPAFGERWARAWLDLARYADSQGYAEDRPRTIWAYRDWVIRALNDNMPFDRFTLEQLAGDLLPGATESQIQATAFHRNTLTNTEGGTDDEEFRNAAVVDRVNTTMQAWMGLTMNCAQCHNHKFDALSQKDYFRLFAFFNNTEDADQPDDRPLLQLFTDEQKRQRKSWEEEIAKLESDLRRRDPALDEARRRWEASLGKPVAWSALRPESGADAGGFVVSPAGQPVVVKAIPDLGSIAAVRVERVPAAGGPLSLTLSDAAGRPALARFVRIELPGPQKYLHVAEVQVWSGAENVAPKGKAAQSSTDFEGEAKRAIDGNTNGDYHAANSVSHTASEDNPWWEVDLGSARPVERVVVWNRTDGGAAIAGRIKGARVRLLDGGRKAVTEKVLDPIPDPSSEWRTDGARPVALRAAGGGFVLEKPLAVAAGTPLVFRLEPVKGGGAAKVRFSVTADDAAALDVPDDVRAILAKPEQERAKAEQERAEAAWRERAPELAGPRDRLAAVRKQLEGQKPSATVPVLRELPAGKRRATHIQLRGNFLVKAEAVTEGVPEGFHAFPADAPKTRLGLARWLVHPDNPLTARVAVNRLWEQIFGTGLVATSEEWGVRGEPPSHPELLDALAVEFVGSGWDVKAMIRRLVTSAAYRQSSRVTPELMARDPANRLLARGPRIRLPAEAVRDQALFAAGLLSRKMYGPSVYPPQPKMGLVAAFSSSIDWEPSKGEDRYRRGLYTFWRRSVTYPSMSTFDAPDRNVCTVKRLPTNTPLQALVTMNDPVYVEASQALARRMVEGGASARERLVHGFRRCLARPPQEGEVGRLLRLYEQSRARYAADPEKSKSMATVPLGPAPAGVDVAELAAWTVVANVLLNLDEMFLMR